MQKSQGTYSIFADRVVLRFFVCAYAALLVLLALSGHQEGSDDVMRWVVVQDLLQGQGWFDSHQYRLGPEGGTLMHWSRLIDAPIALLYGTFGLVLPPDMALQVTAFVWPSLLAGLTLWAFAVTGSVLGAREGAVSALVVGVLALEHSRKFDYFSFDHHNAQILLFVTALMLFALRRDKPYAGWLLGACLALSVSIGTESILQIALVAVFFTIDWIVNGEPTRRRTMAFGIGLVVTLVLTSLATTGHEAFLFPSCDALTLSVALPASVAAAGLCIAAWIGSSWSLWGRIGACVAVGMVTLACAYGFAPHCLSNPIEALPQDMRDYWLSQVAEAQKINVILQLHRGEALALIAMSILCMAAALIFAVRSPFRLEYALFLALIVTGLVVFLYQSRMMTFLGVSLVAVQAQILRVLYSSYASRRRALSGFAMVAFILCISPKTGASIDEQLGRFAGPSLAASAMPARQSQQSSGASCKTPEAYAALRDLPAGRVLVDFDFAANVLRHTDHSVLAGNYHRNQAGILAQIELFRSDADQVGSRLTELDVDYVMLCTSAPRAEFWSWASQGRGLQSHLVAGEILGYLTRVQTTEDAAFQVFKVTAAR
ncbi:hypothetical protein [Ruegeria sp. HKCCA0235A]|uniref:hypothetical protein n=1 Tax=Ruegeria sp. HKCCA0235A TaxID=2682998 RepID=UPI001489FD03|nr:hypothetical protein [Ruegeria sp. HKCCA0235A]